jgi:putative tryptophan/tyrosine transport system substrate-binding protein
MAKKSKKLAKRPSKTARRTIRAKAKKARPSQAGKSKSTPKSRGRPMRSAKRIGFLIAAKRTDWNNYIRAFERKLRDRGWTIGSGTNRVDIDYQPPNGAAGDPELLSRYAKEFVRNNVDVIVTSGTEASLVCKHETSTIPIVFAAAGDPVGSGLVTSLQRPGENVTGCSNLQADRAVIDRRINLMRNRLRPTKVGVIGNNNPPIFPVDAAINLARDSLNNAGVAVAPKSLGYFTPDDFRDVATIQAKLTPLQQDGVDVLYVCSDPVLTAHARDLIRAARNLNMRTMHEIPEARGHGGNQTFGPSFRSLFSKAAELVDQILRTTLPGDIPVFVPNTFEQDPP